MKSSGFSLPYPPEYKRYRPNEPLLRRVSEATAGMALKSPAEAARPVPNPGETISELWPYLLIFAAILVPFDVGARRVAVPAGQMFQHLLIWLRARRRAKTPAAVPEPVARLQKAKERIAKGPHTPDQPLIITPTAEMTEPVTKAPSSPQSAAARLLEAKRKRKDQWRAG